MRNYENEQYAFLAHYGIPGMKRPRGLRYKTKNHAGGPASSFIGKRKPTKFITNATSHLNSDVSSDVTEFYKNKAKGESNNSLRLKRIAQVRATEAMAPVAAAQKNLFKKKKELPINQKAIKLLKIKNAINNNYKNKKNAFLNNTFVQPALEARKPENQAAHVVRKATKKSAEKTTNFLKDTRKSMENQLEKAKKKPSNAINTGIKASGSNFISDTRKSMEKQLEKAKKTENRAANVVKKAVKKSAENTNPLINGNKRKSLEKQIDAKKATKIGAYNLAERARANAEVYNPAKWEPEFGPLGKKEAHYSMVPVNTAAKRLDRERIKKRQKKTR